MDTRAVEVAPGCIEASQPLTDLYTSEAMNRVQCSRGKAQSEDATVNTIIDFRSILERNQSISQRAAVRAVEIAGHEEVLAGFLGVSGTEVKRWVYAKSNPSSNVFLALVDIVAANFLTPSALFNLRNRPPAGDLPGAEASLQGRISS